MPDVRVLSFHATYQCGHSLRCCSSGWPIDVQAHERQAIEHAIDAGRFSPTGGGRPFVGEDHAQSIPGLRVLGLHDGRCVFCDDGAQGGCRVHRALGHDALPLACRQFPRIVVRDPRGVSVTLSHYCPTAAGLLSSRAAPVALALNPPEFPTQGEYVGLDADPTLPPLLHPRLAMDWESWWHFEQLSLDLLATAPQPLERLAIAVEHARRWEVDRGPLRSHLDGAFASALSAPIRPTTLLSTSAIADMRRLVLAAVPPAWQQQAADALDEKRGGGTSDIVWRRFLAAHAFANWTAYLGEGLRAWFASVQAAACLLVHTGDPGRADLALRHLADSSALVAHWNPFEHRSLT